MLKAIVPSNVSVPGELEVFASFCLNIGSQREYGFTDAGPGCRCTDER